MQKILIVSPKYGMNSTMAVCFWCGNDKGHYQLGRLNDNDDKAPKRMVVDYEMCDDCKKDAKDKIHVIKVCCISRDDMLPIIKDVNGNNLYPDSSVLVDRELIKELVHDERLLDDILSSGRYYINEHDEAYCLFKEK